MFGTEKKTNPPYSDEKQNSTDQQSSCVIFRKEFQAFADGVSIVGFKYACLSGANVFRRLIWFLLVIGGVAFMVSQIRGRILYFTSNPTAVDIRYNWQSEIKFPTVTICNENRMTKSALDALELADILEPVYPPWQTDSYYAAINKTALSVLEQNSDHEELEKFLAPYYFAKTCEFDGNDCPGDLTFKTTALGMCLQFNAEGNVTLARAGQKYGLELVLFTNDSDYGVINSVGRGFRILIHDSTVFPNMEEWGLYVPAGMVQNFPLTVRNITSLPKPFGNCTDTPGYRHSVCIAQCKSNFFVKSCNCRIHYLPLEGTSNISVCSHLDYVNCVKNATDVWYDQGLENGCGCDRQCHQIVYEQRLHQSVMSAKFASFLTTNLLKSDGDPMETSQAYTLLNIYLSELKVEEVIAKRAYTVQALFCDIGGALGLILGSTVLTLFEFTDFFITTGWRCMTQKSKRTNHKQIRVSPQ